MRFSETNAKYILFYLSSKISFYVNIFLVVWSIEAFGSFRALFFFVFLLHLSSFEMRERRQKSKYLSWIDQRGQNRKLWQRREVRAFQRNYSKKTIRTSCCINVTKALQKLSPEENILSIMCGTEINFVPFTQKSLSL